MNSATKMAVTELMKFVADCELADCTHADHESALMAPGAAVVGSSIVAFTEGVSRQNKEDIMNSFLFATLVANKAFDPVTQHEDWYRKYNDVLTNFGWLGTGWTSRQSQVTQSRFSMDEVGLEIIGSAIAAAALPISASAALLGIAGEAVAALKKKKEPLRLFDRQAKSHSGASFRIVACTESVDGRVRVVMGGLNFEATSSVTNVLFFEWKAAEVKMYQGDDVLLFNAGVYSSVRESVLQRLGQNAQDAIAEYEI